MPSTWPVMVVATLHRSFWLKEIVRWGCCESTGCATLKVADGFCGKLKRTKASQNPRAYLQSAGSGLTWEHINCQIILRTSIVWVRWHVSKDLCLVSSRSMKLSFYSAKIGGGLQEWTAHLDAQSLQAGLHYMLCVDLDGVPLVAFSCRCFFAKHDSLRYHVLSTITMKSEIRNPASALCLTRWLVYFPRIMWHCQAVQLALMSSHLL